MFAVSIDTISSDMYLDTPSSECSSLCFSEPGTNVYNMSLSSTGKDLGFKGMGTFGFGNVTGDVVSDSVSVEGFGVSYGAIVLVEKGRLLTEAPPSIGSSSEDNPGQESRLFRPTPKHQVGRRSGYGTQESFCLGRRLLVLIAHRFERT